MKTRQDVFVGVWGRKKHTRGENNYMYGRYSNIPNW